MDSTVCYIKDEFRIERKEKCDILPDAENTLDKSADSTDPPAKKQKTEHKKNRGQNKSRPQPFKEKLIDRLCRTLTDGASSEEKCSNQHCKFTHDIKEYLTNKPKDIAETCYIYSLKGYCNFGVTCRYAQNHLDENLNNMKSENHDNSKALFSNLSYDLQKSLRKRTYDFKKAEKYVKEFEEIRIANEKPKTTAETSSNTDSSEAVVKPMGFVPDTDIIKERKSEKKLIDFRDKLYLSPLTTVGNLPFRRICKEFGVDITCGEMACSVPIINGAQQEWALTKRHPSEDIFGVQICGHKSKLVANAAQVLAENIDVDFIDLNLGCPIDLIYQQGGGSALIRRPNVLEVMVSSCAALLNTFDKQFTCKTRTGVYSNKSVAHELIPKFEEWGASLVTIHGRSREQRYTKNADWSYIEKCASQAKSMPVFGNGDILSFQDYNEIKISTPSISGVMIGRGALIKPWIFKEIKEQKPYDISGSERLDLLKKYVNYGLEHWGSDTKGVENTRKFLLEWLSFSCRYVPYGILETPPQRINQRPQSFRGRDDMEAMLSSSNCADWIKISEILLGPVPEGFNFLPKHKANSY